MNKLRRLRLEKDMTIRDLEEVSGVSKETISGIERDRRNPQALTLARLATALGVDVEEFMGEREAPKELALVSK